MARTKGPPRFLTEAQANNLLVSDAMQRRRTRPGLLERLDVLRQARATGRLTDRQLDFVDWAEGLYPRVHAEQQAELAAKRKVAEHVRGPRKTAVHEAALEAGEVTRISVADKADENRARATLNNAAKRLGIKVRTRKVGSVVEGVPA